MKIEENLASDISLQSYSQDNLVVRHDETEKKELWGTRHTFAFLGFLGFSLIYAMRINLSVAIVAMVIKDNLTMSGNDTSAVDDLACPLPDDEGDEGNNDVTGEFDWDEKKQGLILGSFFWGYALTNLLGGMAAERWGGRLVLGLSMFSTAILTMVSPVAARTSDTLFIAVRILEGMTEGVSFPAVNTMMASWVLPEERSKFSAFVYAGPQFGTVITMSATGFLCDSEFLGGWPSAFYVFGFLAFVWCIFWFPLVRNTPAEHPRISKQELTMLAPIALVKTEGSKSVPWRSILTSVPFWGTLIMHFGYNWGFYTLLTELPTYLDQIQHFSLSSSGVLSALPYAIMYVFSIVYSQIVDRLTASGRVTIINVRRVSMAIGCYIPMAALIGMCFVGCDRVLAIAVLCVAVGACGSIYCGYMCSHMDLAPRYAGTLMGLTNTIATIPGFVGPAVAGAFTNDNQTLDAWRNVFLVTVGLYAVTTTVYILTITADVQPWNYYGTENYDEEKVKKNCSVTSTGGDIDTASIRKRH